MTTLVANLPQSLVQDEIVALPGRAGRLLVTIGTATSIGFSNLPDMTGEATIAATAFQTSGASITGVDVSGGFIQANGGTATVRWVPY